MVERRTAAESPGSREEQIYRVDASGRLAQTDRESSKITQQNGSTVTETASYSTSSSGSLDLIRQSVLQSTKTEAGERQVVTVYDVSGQPKLREQQIIDRTVTPDGAVETLSVRDADPNNPKQLGPARKVSESVCHGKC